MKKPKKNNKNNPKSKISPQNVISIMIVKKQITNENKYSETKLFLLLIKKHVLDF